MTSGFLLYVGNWLLCLYFCAVFLLKQTNINVESDIYASAVVYVIC